MRQVVAAVLLFPVVAFSIMAIGAAAAPTVDERVKVLEIKVETLQKLEENTSKYITDTHAINEKRFAAIAKALEAATQPAAKQ